MKIKPVLFAQLWFAIMMIVYCAAADESTKNDLIDQETVETFVGIQRVFPRLRLSLIHI